MARLTHASTGGGALPIVCLLGLFVYEFLAPHPKNVSEKGQKEDTDATTYYRALCKEPRRVCAKNETAKKHVLATRQRGGALHIFF